MGFYYVKVRNTFLMALKHRHMHTYTYTMQHTVYQCAKPRASSVLAKHFVTELEPQS